MAMAKTNRPAWDERGAVYGKSCGRSNSLLPPAGGADAGAAGLGGALNYLSEIGTEAIIKKERSLIKRLEDQIRDLQNIHLYGNPDSSQRVGILSFNMGDEDSAYVADWLFEEEEIAVRSGAHCAPLMHETLGTKMQGAVRISVSHKNTEEEIDRTAKAIKKLSQLLE